MPGHSRPYHQIWMMYLLGELTPYMTEINVMAHDAKTCSVLPSDLDVPAGWLTPLDNRDKCNGR
jgi:hypothetical protein